jgi:hypothetical protein
LGSGEAQTVSTNLRQGEASGIEGLHESGIWEYCEEAEVIFSIPSDSSSILIRQDDSSAVVQKSHESQGRMPMETDAGDGYGNGEVTRSVEGVAFCRKVRACQNFDSDHDMLPSSAAMRKSSLGSGTRSSGSCAPETDAHCHRNLRARTSIKYAESSDGSGGDSSGASCGSGDSVGAPDTESDSE